MNKHAQLKKISGYYFITDASLSRRGIIRDVREALAAGVTCIQYRDKNASTAQLYREALVLKGLCKRAVLIINDRVDIALAVKADGVHLGQEDMPVARARVLLGKGCIIGVSVHSFTQAQAALRAGADYLGVGPVFPTQTKADAQAPVGPGLIKRIRGICSLPLIAIGGITLANAPSVLQAGADGLCAISAVARSRSCRRTMREFQGQMK